MLRILRKHCLTRQVIKLALADGYVTIAMAELTRVTVSDALYT